MADFRTMMAHSLCSNLKQLTFHPFVVLNKNLLGFIDMEFFGSKYKSNFFNSIDVHNFRDLVQDSHNLPSFNACSGSNHLILCLALSQLELKLGLGGTSYADFIQSMHLPMQLRYVQSIHSVQFLTLDGAPVRFYYFAFVMLEFPILV